METEDILPKIQKLFPNEKIQQGNSGWSSWTFSTKDKIIRVPKQNVGIDIYKREADILDFLQDKITVQIPKTIVYEDNPPRIIHKKIRGKNWSLKSYNKLNEKNKNLFCKDIAVFFSELHSAFKKKDIEGRFSYLAKNSSIYNLDKIIDTLKNE